MNHAVPFPALIPRGGEAKPLSGPQNQTTKCDVISTQEERTCAWDTGIPTTCEAGGPWSKDLLQVPWRGDLLRWCEYDADDRPVIITPVFLSL